MNFSSIEVGLRGLQYELNSVDIATLSGADSARVLDLILPFQNSLDALAMQLAAHAVACNQHNADGAKSGASWVASKMGVSEAQARCDLGTQKLLEDMPDVQQAFSSGEISTKKATAVARGAGGSVSATETLLAIARTGTVEEIDRKAREIKAKNTNESEHEKLRKSQFVKMRKGRDSMVTGEFRLLPEFAAALQKAKDDAKGDTVWERAESFIKNLGQLGKTTTKVIFHVDLVDGGAELEGHGPVARESVMSRLADASMTLVGTINNKLVWFSEEDRRSSTRPLPEFVKRAVLAKSDGRCEAPGCTSPAAHVDHILARCNKGVNDPNNLQSMCEPDHHAKTKVDAPWTVGGIYGKYRDTG